MITDYHLRKFKTLRQCTKAVKAIRQTQALIGKTPDTEDAVLKLLKRGLDLLDAETAAILNKK